MITVLTNSFLLACEKIRFSSLFAAGDVSHGGTCSSARKVPSGKERGETDAGVSQATFLPVTMMLVSQARRIACENSPHVRKSGARNRRNSC